MNLPQNKPTDKDKTRPGQNTAEQEQKPQPVKKETLAEYAKRMNEELFAS